MYVAVLFALAITSAWAQYSPKEAALGAHLASEFRKQNRVIENAPVQDYLAALMRRVYPDRTLTVQLSTGDSCGPVAFPGGHLFVPTPLFLESQEESELAAKLVRAVERTLVKPARSSPDSIPLIFVGGWMGECPGNGLLIPKAYQEELKKADSIAEDRLQTFQPSPQEFAQAREIVRGLLPAEPVRKKPTLLRDR